jgi:beta-carotene 15,15'-dioxygenase
MIQRRNTQSLTNQFQFLVSQPLIRFTLLVSWLAVCLLCVLQILFPQVTEQYGLYSLIVGIVFLGLPHGALDHLVPSRMGFAWGRKPLGMSLYLLTYIFIAALYFGLWLWQPLVAFVGFLLATVLHWGQGDVRFLEIFLERKRSSKWGAGISMLLRGSLPMVLPILAFPETAKSLYLNATRGLGVATVGPELSSPISVASLVIYMFVLFILYIVNAIKVSANLWALCVDVFELVLLTLLFCTVPAYMSVGIYFIAWHSLRHLARLIILKPNDAGQLTQGQWQQPIKRLVLDLLPITLAALGLLLGLYVWKAQHVTTLETFVALYLVLISALTKPQLVVVALMDYAPKKESY